MKIKKISINKVILYKNKSSLNFGYLIGLFEGKGFFSISKQGKYLTYTFCIQLSIKDVQLIYKIRQLLGIGVVSFQKTDKMVSLRITYFSGEKKGRFARNKDHLKNIIIPIFDKYPMFSKKQYDYLRFKNALLSNIIYWEDLAEYIINSSPINTIESIINSDYFPAWLVGFIEAEGCFSCYKYSKNFIIASFDISQTDGEIIISAIRKYLYFTTALYIDKTNNSCKLKVTSVRHLENVIKFLNKAPVKLLGNKKLQYLLWIQKLRTISRYSQGINIPSNY